MSIQAGKPYPVRASVKIDVTYSDGATRPVVFPSILFGNVDEFITVDTGLRDAPADISPYLTRPDGSVLAALTADERVKIVVFGTPATA